MFRIKSYGIYQGTYVIYTDLHHIILLQGKIRRRNKAGAGHEETAMGEITFAE